MTTEDIKPKKTHSEALSQWQDWLDKRIPIWKNEILNLSLLAEKPLNEAELTLATIYLGEIYKSVAQTQVKWKMDAFFEDYSVAITRVIAGIGYRNYEKGNFWDGFWDAIKLTPKFQGDRFAGRSKPEISADWGRCFLGVLDQLELPSFSGHQQKYVVPILLHAGIPISCLSNYFMAIDRGLSEVGFNAEAIVHYLSGDGANHSYGINKPVTRFLQEGGEFAIEFVDRSIDALAKLARSESLDSHPLPSEVLNAAKEYFQEQQGGWGSQTRRGRALKAGKVEITLNVAFGEINLDIPEINTYVSDFVWELNLDEEFIELIPRTIPGGDFSKRQSMNHVIDRPTRRLSIRASDGGVSRDLALYDSEFPAIFFTIDGELIPRNVALPKGITYALIAKDKTKSFDLNSEWIQQEISPTGWHTWELFRLDLSEIPTLQLFEGGPTKSVASKLKATIGLGRLVDGLTADGLAIAMDRPNIFIPAGINAQWQIELRDMNEGAENVLIEIVGTLSEQEIDAFADYESKVFGLFEIFVRGPLGLGASQRLGIMEDISIERPGQWRTLNSNGLSDHIAEFSSNFFSIKPSISFLDSKTLSQNILFEYQDRELNCLYSPSAMSIATRTAGIPQPWQYGPADIDFEDIEKNELMIRVPSAYSEMQLSLVTNDVSHQSISTTLKQNKHIVSYELSNFKASLKVLKEADLYFDFQGLKLRVGRIRPREIATGIEATNHEIFLKDFSGGDVVLRIWSINEPWHNWIDVNVPISGIVRIPDEFMGLGSLCVEWERIDPWAISVLSDLPTASKLQVLVIFSSPTYISELGKQIESGSISGRARFSKLSHCWTAIIMSQRIGNPARMSSDVIRNAAALIREEPIHALEVLSLMPITAAETLAAMGVSGVLSAPISKGIRSKLGDGEITSRFKRSSNAILFPIIATAMYKNSPKHFPEMWKMINIFFGDVFTEIATTGIISQPQAGGFAGMERVLGVDPSQADFFVSLTGAYPRELLHVDSRMLAGLALFKSREAFREYGKSQPLEKALIDIQHEFTMKMPFVHNYINSRTSPQNEGWQVLAALSLALAFLNRGTAHGLIDGSSRCSRYSELTDLMSTHVPELFLADFALADLVTVAQTEDRRPIVTLENIGEAASDE